MKQNTTTNLTSQTIGLDLGDKHSVAVVLAPSGEVLEELKLQTTRASLSSAFGAQPACRISLEVLSRKGLVRLSMKSARDLVEYCGSTNPCEKCFLSRFGSIHG